jgi:hypothetical protein
MFHLAKQSFPLRIQIERRRCVCGGEEHMKYDHAKPLIDDELPEGETYDFDRGVRWAESKLKEKNT